MKRISMILLASAAPLWSLAVGAQTTTSTGAPATSVTTTDTSPVTALGGGGSPAETRIVNEFSMWSGSEGNARSLVTGLRQGGEITLSASASDGPTGTGTPDSGTAFSSPTRPMGYGNVRIALVLAKEQLAQAGITDPTPAQIQAALVGGTITSGTGATTTTTALPGVLQMRADGMGWGRIANSMGVKLGQVISGKTPTSPQPAATEMASGNISTASGAGVSAGSGITTAAGASSTTVATRGRGNSTWAHQTHSPDAGIVTATGEPASGASAGARAYGGGRSAGVVTAAGVTAGGGTSAAGRGQGRGHAGR